MDGVSVNDSVGIGSEDTTASVGGRGEARGVPSRGAPNSRMEHEFRKSENTSIPISRKTWLDRNLWI
jgi:hypothetical protein